MANITELIKNIRNAILGKDVRESIAGAIEQCYEDASKNGNANMEVAEARGSFETLKKRLDSCDDKIQSKRDKNMYITMEDLGQDVKTAMTGGSVAVVGNQSVDDTSVKDYSLSPSKFNFVEIRDNNLLNMSLINNYFIDVDGSQKTGNYVSSDFIPIGDYIINETTFYSNNVNGAFIIYNDEQEFIKYVAGHPDYVTIDVENASYLKMNILKNQDNYNNLYLYKDNARDYKNISLNKINHRYLNNIAIPTENLVGNNISPDHTNFIKHTTNNLFNKNLADKNGFFELNGWYRLNSESPSLSNYGSYVMQIDNYIKDETIFYQGSAQGYINFFDINFNWLGKLDNPNVNNFTIPFDNVVYITKSLPIEDFNTYYLLKGTNELIDNYELDSIIEINLDINSILNNKKIGFLGDSITYGLSATKPYPTVIQENTGCISINYGISGNSIAKAGSNGQENAQNNPMCVRYNAMAIDLDYILIFGGTNDYAYQIPIGESNSTDITTFNGALNTLIKGLIERYPGKPILFLTPLHRVLDHENGIKFNEYVEAIIQRTSYYSIPYFNLTDRSTIDSLIDTINNMYYANQDRLHPNDEGHKILARIIQHQLEII